MNAEEIQEQFCGESEYPAKAYRIEREKSDKSCKACRHGDMWDVVGPDDVAISVSYEREEDALDMADQLSMAFALGKKAGGHLLIDEITVSAMAEMHGSAVDGYKSDLRKIVDDWE